MISVVIPTIQGREESLDRCVAAYRRWSPADTEIIIIHDKPTCGIAWNDGYAQTNGNSDYIHYSADDLEPLQGWWQPAVRACNNGDLPAPRLLNSDGTLQAGGNEGEPLPFTRVPFLSHEQAARIYPVIETHYYTDVWVSEVGRCYGYETVYCPGYQLKHHWAQEGRLPESQLALDEHACRAQFRWLLRDRRLRHPAVV